MLIGGCNPMLCPFWGFRSTLVLCFLSLLLFPSDILRSMGLGCAIGLAVAITVNLTLTPALLLAFPNFFKRCILPSKILGFFCGSCYKVDPAPVVPALITSHLFPGCHCQASPSPTRPLPRFPVTLVIPFPLWKPRRMDRPQPTIFDHLVTLS